MPSNKALIEMNSKYSDSSDNPSSHNYDGEQPTPSPAASFTLHPNRRYNTILKGETQHCNLIWREREGRDKVKNYGPQKSTIFREHKENFGKRDL